MNVRELEHLTEDERELVLMAPALVAVLISGADGDFDPAELNQAITAVHYRADHGEQLLKEYYHVIDKKFESVLYHVVQKYDGNKDERALKIIGKLEQLNVILPKVDRRFARILLDDLRSLAKSVATAAGGFLGYARISYAESHLIDLKMITYQP